METNYCALTPTPLKQQDLLAKETEILARESDDQVTFRFLQRDDF